LGWFCLEEILPNLVGSHEESETYGLEGGGGRMRVGVGARSLQFLERSGVELLDEAWVERGYFVFCVPEGVGGRVLAQP
jgi:hypothetical protein